MPRPPKLAAFLPNYNHAHFLGLALDAILAQSVQPDVIDIVDDGSTDDSLIIARRYADRYPNIRVHEISENRGILKNMVDWLRKADSDYVYFAASDDLVLPGLFEKSMGLLTQYPQAGLCSALCRIIDEEGRDLGVFNTPTPIQSPGYIPPDDVQRFLMKDDSWFNGSSTIYRREALLEVGGFYQELGAFIDGFSARLAALHAGACFVAEPLACWRRSQNGLAGQQSTDPTEALLVADHVQTLIRDRYSDLFPQKYYERWRGRWLFGVLRAILGSGDTAAWVASRRCLGSGTSPVLRLAFSPHLTRMKAWRMLLIVFGFLRLRPHDAVTVGLRRLRYRIGSQD
ncbi:glycosyltransferase [Rhodospirillaceae bacterium KN72]|uniref:Glycosyltransferase n=1 Tax=Pacificispira spongiicola TaxID=2729598 RepID=A0A7Y0E5E2_9PROT|nr:glycosyltransferase [Pacificispira spongiicola]NMM46726.1 glycosyltransferase [Pacificispira spongiicola]